MTTPELSLNERLAIAFDGYEEIHFSDFDDSLPAIPPDYCNDNLSAFSLLEKAKQDGKILDYKIISGPAISSCIVTDKSWSWCGDSETISKAITQALAQLLTEDK